MSTTKMISVPGLAPAASAEDSAGSVSARSLASQIGTAVTSIRVLRDKQQRGPLAELRRLRPLKGDGAGVSEIPGDAFWSLVERAGIAPRDEPFWIAVLPLMVRHPHQSGIRPGRALEAAGISKSRFERWLRFDRDRALLEAPRLFSKLKDQSLDWIDLGHSLHRWNDEDRHRMARDFFLARERREHTHTDGAE